MSYQVDDLIPEWVMESVSPERMKTMAAILRDPNPIHWDRQAVDSLPLDLGARLERVSMAGQPEGDMD